VRADALSRQRRPPVVQPAKETIMAKGQVNRGTTNKPKLTAKEKAKKKKAKAEKAGKS